MELMDYYRHENDKKRVLKYIKMASTMSLPWREWIRYVQYAIEYGSASNQRLYPLIEANQCEYALQQSICHFHGLGTTKSNQKSVGALQKFASAPFYVGLEVLDSNRISIRDIDYFWVYQIPESAYMLSKTAVQNYADFLFKANQFIPFPWIARFISKLFSCLSNASSSLPILACTFPRLFSEAAMSGWGLACPWRHLRIAADSGNSDAQFMCLRLFGRRASVSKGVKLVEKKRDGKQEKEKRRPRGNQSEKNKEDSRKKRNKRASRNRDVTGK